MAKAKKNKQTPAQAEGTPSPAPHIAPGSVPAAAVIAHAIADERHEHVGHIVPLWVLGATFGGLMVLTFVTVAASWIDLGRLNLWLAMSIAGLKATLVVLFFMHLKWDRPVNMVIFLSSLLFVVLFIGFALTDTESYQPDIAAWDSTNP